MESLFQYRSLTKIMRMKIYSMRCCHHFNFTRQERNRLAQITCIDAMLGTSEQARPVAINETECGFARENRMIISFLNFLSSITNHYLPSPPISSNLKMKGLCHDVCRTTQLGCSVWNRLRDLWIIYMPQRCPALQRFDVKRDTNGQDPLRRMQVYRR